MKKISILLVDDHIMVREALIFVLHSDCRLEVIAQTSLGKEAVQLAMEKRPEIILMDISLEDMSGIEATREIKKLIPGIKIICLTMYDLPAIAKEAMKAGAKGYVTKNSTREQMIQAIISVYNGMRYVSPDIQLWRDKNDNVSGLQSLTFREIEIVQLIKKGMSSKEVGEHLNISTKTIEVHRYNVLKKLKLRNVAELVSFTEVIDI
ncbi:MAG TPA: response regulator transcription factor [Candidatus Brocadiaceae bacterium]